jgi:hypothetical protein
MNENIEEGDYVRHKSPLINSGLRMCVEEIDENQINARCSHFVGVDAIHKVDWFPLTDLILVNKAEGGFV